MTFIPWVLTAVKVARARIATLPAGTEAGFTLLELLVVLAILGLAVALAVPAFDRVMPGLELKATARGVAAALRQARGLAVSSNREVAVTIDVNAHTLDPGRGRPAAQLDPRFDLRLYTATDELVGGSAGNIRFFPDGTSTGGRVRVVYGTRKYDVLVNWITGVVTIRE
jgi:general secretion pathway protein H